MGRLLKGFAFCFASTLQHCRVLYHATFPCSFYMGILVRPFEFRIYFLVPFLLCALLTSA